jgi:hypothetical protein
MHTYMWHYIKVHDPLHAFAALPMLKDALVPTGLVGPRMGLGTASLPLQGIKFRFQSHPGSGIATNHSTGYAKSFSSSQNC